MTRIDGAMATTTTTQRLTAIAIGILGAAYLYLSSIGQGRDFFPKFHDESMHLLQAQMLAHGRLWMPPHPLPQFFETFHVFVTPVYTAMQFPGASLFYVPGTWLHLPYWVTTLAIAGATVAMIYHAVAEAIDGVSGMIAAILLL